MMDRQSEVEIIKAMFLPLDLAMDLSVLTLVQLALDRLSLPRLLRAQLALSAFTLLGLAFPQLAVPVRILIYPLAAALLLGSLRPRRILEGAAGIFCAYAAAAGFSQLAGARWPALTAGMLLFGCLLRKKRHIRSRWNTEITLEKNGLVRRFPALIDTGNRLREHRSGLPVLIVEEAAVPGIREMLDPAECRVLPYGVLGSAGEICCFRPDNLLTASHRAPECWVALFPGKIPGRIRALAPPEFIEYTRDRPDYQLAFQNTLRRFYHGVFKHKAVHLRPGGSDSPGFGVLYRRE